MKNTLALPKEYVCYFRNDCTGLSYGYEPSWYLPPQNLEQYSLYILLFKVCKNETHTKTKHISHVQKFGFENHDLWLVKVNILNEG